MTTDLEKQFFDTFGIEPEPCINKGLCFHKNCVNCEYSKYPIITDRRLLKLIVIAFNHYYEIDFSELDMSDVNSLKDAILELLIEFVAPDEFNEGVYEDVQALFKE